MTAPAKRFKLSSVEFRGCITLGLLIQVVFFSLLPLPMPLETFCKGFQSAVSAVFDGSDSVALAEHTLNHRLLQAWAYQATLTSAGNNSNDCTRICIIQTAIACFFTDLVELRLAMTRSYMAMIRNVAKWGMVGVTFSLCHTSGTRVCPSFLHKFGFGSLPFPFASNVGGIGWIRLQSFWDFEG